MSKKRVLSGIQPTHDSFHLGNYLGALKQWVDMQENHDAFYCVVDLHALTVETDPKLLKKRTLLSAAQLIAIGLNPNKCTLFVQSHVPAHNQLAWVFECITGFGEASRMTQFKDKSQKSGADRINVGLFTYPILQAADILLYQPDFVPVGEDQRQHVELTRDIAQRFNSKYKEIFNIPKPEIIKSLAKINDLQDPNAKMSKSDPSDNSRINMTDDADMIMQKIRKAKTDPDALPSEVAGLADRPEASNLVGIYAALAACSTDDVLAEFGGRGFGDFKPALGDLAVAKLSPIGAEMRRLLENPADIDAILADGAERAAAIARPILAEVRDIVGFLGSSTDR